MGTLSKNMKVDTSIVHGSPLTHETDEELEETIKNLEEEYKKKKGP